MTLLNGITHLTNWMGNVIMPTLAGLFFALSVVRYARGYPHQYIAWAGLMCLMVSGLLRGLETFASQSAWNNPDTIWITLRGLVNWTCNVFMPVYRRAANRAGSTGLRRGRATPLSRDALGQALCGGWNGTGAFGPAATRGGPCSARR